MRLVLSIMCSVVGEVRCLDIVSVRRKPTPNQICCDSGIKRRGVGDGIPRALTLMLPVQRMTPHTPVQRFIPGAPVKEIPSVKKLGVIERVDTERKRVAKNIMDVDINEDRIQMLNSLMILPGGSERIVY